MPVALSWSLKGGEDLSPLVHWLKKWLNRGWERGQRAMRNRSPSCISLVTVTCCHQRKFTSLPFVALQPHSICSVATHNSLCPKPVSPLCVAAATVLLHLWTSCPASQMTSRPQTLLCQSHASMYRAHGSCPVCLPENKDLSPLAPHLLATITYHACHMNGLLDEVSLIMKSLGIAGPLM